jgi:glycosyltransferase involved in cell wall biosynthesis
MEAIAAEVALLRGRFPRSVAWGLSRRHWLLLSRRRGYCLNSRLHLLFRAATRVLEPAFQLNHIFGSLGDWFYLVGTKRRPTVLTVAAWELPVQEQSLLRRIDRFIVEHPAGVESLQQLGIERERVRLIFPPVNLKRFVPALAPDTRFTVLFASSPDDETWLEARGLPQILEAAARRPRMLFRLLWRPWGNSLGRVRQWITERGLENVDLVLGCWGNMAEQYNAAHVTVLPFTDPRRCKPAPNSLIESLACGRPVVATPAVGLAELVREGNAGLVCAATGESLAACLDRLQAEWAAYARAARRLAERCFAAEGFLEAYGRVYAEVVTR